MYSLANGHFLLYRITKLILDFSQHFEKGSKFGELGVSKKQWNHWVIGDTSGDLQKKLT